MQAAAVRGLYSPNDFPRMETPELKKKHDEAALKAMKIVEERKALRENEDFDLSLAAFQPVQSTIRDPQFPATAMVKARSGERTSSSGLGSLGEWETVEKTADIAQEIMDNFLRGAAVSGACSGEGNSGGALEEDGLEDEEDWEIIDMPGPFFVNVGGNSQQNGTPAAMVLQTAVKNLGAGGSVANVGAVVGNVAIGVAGKATEFGIKGWESIKESGMV